MKKNLLSLLIALSLASVVSAQPDIVWIREIGGGGFDQGFCVQQTDDLGFILVGRTSSFGAGGYDVYLVKTDSSGLTQWARTYGGDEDDEGYSVQQTFDHGYVIAGYTDSFGISGSRDIYVIKTDADGDTLWTRSYGEQFPDEGYSIEQCDDGGYIVGGVTNSYSSWTENMIIIKIDGVGQVDWLETYGNSQDQGANCVSQTSDGGFIVAGYHHPYPYGQWQGYLVKTTPFGEEIWHRYYSLGGTSNECFYCVDQANDGGYILAGFSDPGFTDAYIVKTDISGLEQWNRIISDPASQNLTWVQQTWDGSYIFAGDWFVSGMSNQVYVLKTDGSGSTLWSQTYGNSNAEWGRCIQQIADGGYIVVGACGGAWTWDVYLMRLAPDVVGVKDNGIIEPPRDFILHPPAPNPFNPTTALSYELRAASHISLRVYDTTGREVKALVNGWKAAGNHEVTFDGAGLASGIYLAKLQAGDFAAVQKIVLLK